MSRAPNNAAALWTALVIGTSLTLVACQPVGPATPDALLPPRADAGLSRTVFVGEVVTFDSSASADPDGEIVGVDWNFGDGTRASDELTTKVFDAVGGYVVALTVTDSDGLTDRSEIVVTVTEIMLVADAVLTPESVNVFEPVTFDASGSVGPADLVAYRWTFGDGTQGEGVTATHEYAAPGTFSVLLEVEDARGDVAQLSGFVDVLPLDVGGQWDATPVSPTYTCSTYTAVFEDTELSFNVEADGTLSATSQMGRQWEGTLDGSDFTLATAYIGQTSASCVQAPVNATLVGSFTGPDAFTGTVLAYYDLSVPCQCSATFQVTGAKR